MINEVHWPVTLLNITAQGFALVPQMYLYIFSGNDEELFDTVVTGGTGMMSVPSCSKLTTLLVNETF